MEDLLHAGNEAYERGDWDAAIVALKHALERDDAALDAATRLQALVRLGSAHMEAGSTVEALQALKAVLEMAPEHAAAWNNLGLVCSRLDRTEEALRAFETARQLAPEDPLILVNLASAELKASDPGAALTHLRQALDLAPGLYAAHVNLALTLLVFGRIEEAEEALRLAVFHGYSDAAPIEAAIAQMKSIRAEHLSRGDAGPGDASDNPFEI